MQMNEVGGEFNGSVDYMVGSQDLEPGEGWPYAPFIKQWVANPTMTPAEVSVWLSRGVYGNKPDTTFSAVNLQKLPVIF